MNECWTKEAIKGCQWKLTDNTNDGRLNGADVKGVASVIIALEVFLTNDGFFYDLLRSRIVT